MSYRAALSHEAEKTLDRLDRSTYERIEKRILELQSSPLDLRISKQLKEADGLRSSRVGGWRILYTVAAETKTMYIVAIRPRGQAYKRM